MTLIEQIKDLINRVENARNFDGSEGKWVTIKGTHVFIPDGKSVEEVMEEKGWGSKKGTEKKDTLKDIKEEHKKVTEQRIAELNEIKAKLKDLDKIKDTQALYDKADKISTYLMGTTGIISEEEQDKYLELAEDIKDKIVDYQTEKDEKKSTSETPKEGKRTKREVSLKDLGLDDLISKEVDKDFSGMPKHKTVKEQKLEDGITEITDQYGRTTFKKNNKWADVMKNGNYYISAYGLTHKTGVSWEDEKGITQDQLLNSRGFKTEKGARKWALDQLKRLTSDNSLEEAFTEALTEIILEQ